jgi:radical SAM superfamily enzyme YgiQ (UPF0313 family)
MKDKKKILFIHPLGVNWVPGEMDMSRISNIMPPLGLLSLAAWVEKHGHTAYIHDCYASPMQDEKIIDKIKADTPDYIGFSTTTSSFLDAVRIAQNVRKVLPGIKNIFGGVHISALREILMQNYPVIDYGVVGEGEHTLLSLIESDGQIQKDVPGLLYREDDQVIFTGYIDQKQLIDLDTLPFPDYDKLSGFPKLYKLPIFNYPTTPHTTAVSSRGCPYQCSYCDRSVFKRTYRFNSAEYLHDFVLHLHRKYGMRHINFYDDLFTFNRKRVEDFCGLLLKSGAPITFNCAARSEHIDKDLLKLMKKAGCWMISLGIETGDSDLLGIHRSNSDLEMIKSKVSVIRETGIRVKGLFMMGLPGETEESIDKSMQYALDLPLSDMNLTKFTPFPGSPVYSDIKKHGTFDEKWELMNCTNFVFIPDGFTRERLEERYRGFYRRHFERHHILLDYATMLWRSPDSWARFLLNLGSFLRIRSAFSGKKNA